MTADLPSEDYQASFAQNQWTISGYVRNATGTGIPGVSMVANWANMSVVTTDSSGFYTGEVRCLWSGTITPSIAGYTFQPVDLLYQSVAQNYTNQNYLAIPTGDPPTINTQPQDATVCAPSTHTFSND